MKYPILYAKDATDFFSLGLGVLTNTLEAKVMEERNGSFFLEAKVLTDTEMYKKIELDSLIKADAGVSLKNQRFRVKRVIENHDGTADIYAEHISYLTQELSLKPNVTVRGPADVAIKAWAANIIDKHPFIVDSDIRTDNSTTWEIGDVDNAREALGGVQGSMLDVWGGEYIFDNYHISLKEKRGKTANALIAYGRNITDFEQEKNIMSTYTSLFPYARYTDDDQNEHLVTLPEYLVDSEYVKNYPNRKALPVDFSSEFEGKNKPTPDKLRTLAKSYIKDNEVGIPKVSIQVSFLDLAKTLDYKEIATLEELNLCDDVRVEYPKLGVSTVSKVVKIVWDVLADRYETIEIGAKRTTLGTTIKEQNDAIKEIEKNTNDALVSSDGKNMIFYGLYGEDGLGEPTATKVGDLWYKPNGDYTIMYVWNGTIWEQVLNTEDEAIIKDELVQMDKDVQEAKDKADEVATGLDVIKIDVDKAIEDSQKAKDDAIKALEENETTKLEAQKAKEQSDQAIKDASTSMLNAKEALDKATENETSIGGLQVDIDKTNNELKTKANQSDLNTLKGTVTNQQTQITQNATDIKTKAEKTYVDTVNNKVDKQQTQINQNSESIKLKAEKQEVTNLKNELDELEKINRNFFINSDNLTEDRLKLLGDSRVGWFKKSEIDGYDFEFSSWYILETKPNEIFGYISAENGKYTDEFYTNSIYIRNDGIVPLYVVDNTGQRVEVKPKEINRVVLTKKFGLSLNKQINFANAGTSAYLTIARPKIERGSKVTEWSNAPEDFATADKVEELSASIEVQAGKIEMKADQVVVDNLKNTVNKQGTAITQNTESIKLKAEKSQVDNLSGKVDKQQTEINQNAEQIKLKANQSVVNDIDKKVTNQQAQINLNSENIKLKAEKTEVTNLKEEVDSIERNNRNYFLRSDDIKQDDLKLLGNSKVGWFKKTIVDGYDFEFSSWYIENTIPNQIFGFVSAKSGNYTDEVYTNSIYVKNDGKADIYISDNIGRKEVVSPGQVKRVVLTGSFTNKIAKQFVFLNAGLSAYLTIARPKIEKGNRATDWSLAPEDLASQSEVTSLSASIDIQANQIKNLVTKTDGHSTQLANLTIESNKISSQVASVEKDVVKHSSQITQLSDDILLRVQKNDVVNQINISTEGILIDGKKVHITGQTTIDSAVIKDAMIANVSANKLTAGTIDANKINVINLNASNMTTGTLKAITISGNNSYWDLTTGLIKMNNPQNVGQNITIQNGRFQSNEGTDKEIFILGDTMTARSLTTTIALDPKKIIFRGDGYVRQLELQGQGLSISSKGQNIGGPEFYNVGLEIEADGDIAYLDFTTKGRNLDYHSRIKSVDGGTTNGSGVLQYESKRHDFVGDEVRFENIKSFSMNNATISSPAKNMVLTSQVGANSVLSIEKAGTGDNHYFNFKLRAANHGITEWGVSAWASDRKLKTNIKPTEIDAIGVINNLNVVQFDWKYDLAHVGVGLVAQEVEEVFPQAVFENLGEIKQLKPEAFIPLLIKNIQELNKRVAELEGGV